MTFWERVEQAILALRQQDLFTLSALGDVRHAQHVRLAEPDEEAQRVIWGALAPCDEEVA